MPESTDDRSPVEAALLPEAARRRLAQYTLLSIRGLPPKQAPPALRFAVDWRPAKLSRAAADRVVAALASEETRELVAAQLVERDEAAARFAEGAQDADRLSRLALLYLIRPGGWEEQLAALLAEPGESAEAAALRQQVTSLERRLAAARERYEQELARAQSQAREHRRGLEEKARRLTEQVAQLQEQLREEREAEQAARLEAAELENAVRRLRKQLAVEQAAADQRKASERSARIAANARAKVLLDVLAKAAAGLAEELQIPVGTPLPADLVAGAEVDRPRRGRIPSAAALGEELTLPRCHVIIDGYNVTKAGWPNLSLQDQREALIKAMAALASRTGAEITVVFDGAAVGRAPAYTTRSVRVRFSEPGQLADQLIVRLVAADTTARPMVVVSGDAAVVSGALAAGARTADRDFLLAVIGRSAR